MILLDGKKTSAEIKQEIANSVKEIKQQGKRVPHLAAVLVGNDGASMTYVGAKVKACEFVGFESTLIKLPEDTSEQALLQQIKALNDNPEKVNDSPYGEGWIIKVEITNPAELDELLDSKTYSEIT